MRDSKSVGALTWDEEVPVEKGVGGDGKACRKRPGVTITAEST